MNKLWFKRKLYGWGWAPASWEGWVVTAVYLMLIALLAVSVMNAPTEREVWLMFLLPLVILTACFAMIAYKKGEAPRWQWGKRKDDQH